MSVESFDTDDFETLSASASMELLSPTTQPTDESALGVPMDLPGPESQVAQNDSSAQEPKETGPTEPVELNTQSLVALLQETPGFELQDAVYRFRGTISTAASEQLYKRTCKVTGITLSDLDDQSIAPSVFMRLGQLRKFFPSLSSLVVENTTSDVDFLSLFVSAALKHLEFAGIDENREPSVAAFLRATAEEVPKLSFIQLARNRFSCNTVEIVAGFAHLNTLHLIDTLSKFDYRFLEALGGIETLVDLTLCQSESSLEYRSRATIIADEEKRRCEQEVEERSKLEATRKAEEEAEQLRIENQNKMEAQRKLDDAKAHLSALGPLGAALISRLDKGETFAEPQSGGYSILEGVGAGFSCKPPCQDILPPASGQFAPPVDPSDSAWGAPRKGRKKRRQEETFSSSFGSWGEGPYSGDREPPPDLQRSATPSIDELSLGAPFKSAPSSPTSPAPSIYSNSSTPDLSADDVPLAASQDPQMLFPNLKRLSVTGPTVMITDLVNATHSASIKNIAISFVRSNDHTNVDSSEVVRLVICKWLVSISQVTVDAEKLSHPLSPCTLTKAVFKKLLLAPNMRLLKLKGWKIEELDASLASLHRLESSPSMLEHLSIPFHCDAPGISLSRLGFIAKSCPNLLSLECRIKHLSNVPMTSREWPSSDTINHKFTHLTVGNAEPHPKIDRALDIARFIAHIFPSLVTLKTLDGPAQNAEQWELIGKIVKMVQEVRLGKM